MMMKSIYLYKIIYLLSFSFMRFMNYQSRRILRKPSPPSLDIETLIRLLEGTITNSSIFVPINYFSFFFFPAFFTTFPLFEFSSDFEPIASPFTRITKLEVLLKMQAVSWYIPPANTNILVLSFSQ